MKINILTYDLTNAVAEATKSIQLKETYKPKFSTAELNAMLNHSLTVFAAVHLPRKNNGKISSTALMAQLKTDDVVRTPNGPMKNSDILNLVKFIYLVPRSEFLLESQNKNPTLGAFTPIFMYAHKLYNNVGYDEWDKTDSSIKVFLGRGLSFLYDLPPLPELDSDRVAKLRKSALTYKSGKQKGKMTKLTDYKCNLPSIPINLEDEIDSTIRMDKNLIRMLLQTWIANAAIRNTESMILDPHNWDNVPEPYDNITPVKYTHEPVQADLEELPW